MNFQEFKAKYEHKEVAEYPNQVFNRPVVSVCVQTYQHFNYIKDCLEGILMQETDFPIEILVGEDGSTDGTRELCIEYAEKYPDKIRLFLHHRENNIKINGNATGRFNFLYNLYSALGKYIALCEGDDYWIDHLKLQKQVDFLESNPDYNLSVGRVLTINEKGSTKKLHEFANVNKRQTYTLGDYITYRFSQTSSFLFRNNFEYQEIFHETFGGDQALVISAVEKKKIYYHEDIFSHYRTNIQSVSFTTKPENKYDMMMVFWKDVYRFTNKKYSFSILMNILLNMSMTNAGKNLFYKLLNIITKGSFVIRGKIIYMFKDIFSGL